MGDLILVVVLPLSFPHFTQLPGNYFKITSKKGLRLQIYTRHHENTKEILVKGSEFIAKEILFVLFKFLAISKAEKSFQMSTEKRSITFSITN